MALCLLCRYINNNLLAALLSLLVSILLLSTLMVNCFILIMCVCVCVSFPLLFFKVCYVTTHGTQSKVSYKQNILCKNSSFPSCVGHLVAMKRFNHQPKLDLHFCVSFLFYTCGRLHCVLEINVDQLLTDSLPGNAVSFRFISGFCNHGISCPPLIHPVHILLHNSAAFSFSAVLLACCRLAHF